MTDLEKVDIAIQTDAVNWNVAPVNVNSDPVTSSAAPPTVDTRTVGTMTSTINETPMKSPGRQGPTKVVRGTKTRANGALTRGASGGIPKALAVLNLTTSGIKQAGSNTKSINSAVADPTKGAKHRTSHKKLPISAARLESSSTKSAMVAVKSGTVDKTRSASDSSQGTSRVSREKMRSRVAIPTASTVKPGIVYATKGASDAKPGPSSTKSAMSTIGHGTVQAMRLASDSNQSTSRVSRETRGRKAVIVKPGSVDATKGVSGTKPAVPVARPGTADAAKITKQRSSIMKSVMSATTAVTVNAKRGASGEKMVLRAAMPTALSMKPGTVNASKGASDAKYGTFGSKPSFSSPQNRSADAMRSSKQGSFSKRPGTVDTMKGNSNAIPRTSLGSAGAKPKVVAVKNLAAVNVKRGSFNTKPTNSAVTPGTVNATKTGLDTKQATFRTNSARPAITNATRATSYSRQATSIAKQAVPPTRPGITIGTRRVSGGVKTGEKSTTPVTVDPKPRKMASSNPGTSAAKTESSNVKVDGSSTAKPDSSNDEEVGTSSETVTDGESSNTSDTEPTSNAEPLALEEIKDAGVKKSLLMELPIRLVKCPFLYCGHLSREANFLRHVLGCHLGDLIVEPQRVFDGQQILLAFDPEEFHFRRNACVGLLLYGGINEHPENSPGNLNYCVHNSLSDTFKPLELYLPVVIMACKTCWNTIMKKEDVQKDSGKVVMEKVEHVLFLWLASLQTVKPILYNMTVSPSTLQPVPSFTKIMQIRPLADCQSPDSFFHTDENHLALSKLQLSALTLQESDDLCMEVTINGFS